MDKLINISEEAIIRYFNTLSQFGYKKYSEVDKILVLFFIEETLSNEFSDFVDEKDYRTITNALYCLMGSTCMIDFPVFETFDSLVHENLRSLVPRITEDSILRYTEDSDLRVIADGATINSCNDGIDCILNLSESYLEWDENDFKKK